MTITKKKIIGNSLKSKINKPSTITRAAITADIKLTRGKQLVEHSPFALIPDPQNPRPGEVIDDRWLKEYLKVGTAESLCKINETTGNFEIPDISALNITYDNNLEASYNSLKSLAYSIRLDGLINPIEIFLADKDNDPEYFRFNNLDYGYVVLEGHQRRLAAIMAGVSSVTCLEITDETTLAKLKVKHRKLRRQLSENNLRKNLTVAQNFKLVRELLTQDDARNLSARELSSIIGLNEDIASALKRIILNIHKYPDVMISMIEDNLLTFSILRKLAGKSIEEIEAELNNDLKGVSEKKVKKARGSEGGRLKKSATFKINDENESKVLQKFLLERFPEINTDEELTFKSLENLLYRIKQLALY